MTQKSGAGRCDLCGSSDGQVLLRGTDRRHGTPGTFLVIRCARCGLGRTHPRPDEVAAAYPDGDYMNHLARTDLVSRAFAQTITHTVTGEWPAWLTAVAVAAVSAARLGGTLAPGARVLDVGCGSGHAVAALRRSGIDAHGIEPDEGAVDVARRSGLETVHHGTLDTFPLEPGAWDLIRFWHTLEHTPSPSDALRRAHEALRPEGRIVVGVPNLDAAARIAFGADWDGLELPRHLHHFTRASLAAMLGGTGFTDVIVRSVAIMGVLAGSLDARTRRTGIQRRGRG